MQELPNLEGIDFGEEPGLTKKQQEELNRLLETGDPNAVKDFFLTRFDDEKAVEIALKQAVIHLDLAENTAEKLRDALLDSIRQGTIG